DGEVAIVRWDLTPDRKQPFVAGELEIFQPSAREGALDHDLIALLVHVDRDGQVALRPRADWRLASELLDRVPQRVGVVVNEAHPGRPVLPAIVTRALVSQRQPIRVLRRNVTLAMATSPNVIASTARPITTVGPDRRLRRRSARKPATPASPSSMRIVTRTTEAACTTVRACHVGGQLRRTRKVAGYNTDSCRGSSVGRAHD